MLKYNMNNFLNEEINRSKSLIKHKSTDKTETQITKQEKVEVVTRPATLREFVNSGNKTVNVILK